MAKTRHPARGIFVGLVRIAHRAGSGEAGRAKSNSMLHSSSAGMVGFVTTGYAKMNALCCLLDCFRGRWQRVRIMRRATRMNVYHLSIHRVPGIIELPGSADVELVPVSSETRSRAFLTMNRGPHYLHLRRIAAIGRSIHNKFSGREAQAGSPEEQFARILAGIQIQEGVHFDSPLLIAEATGTIENVALDKVNLLGEIGFGANLFDDANLAAHAKQAIEVAVTGLALALPIGEFREVETLGSVSYLVDPSTNRIVYSLGSNFIKASGRVSTSVTAETLATAAQFATNLRGDTRLGTVGRLLSQSSLATDNLTAFLTAWAGLEVFTNKTFKDAYEPLVFTTLEDASPAARKPFIDRLRDVMTDKYNIRDKFVVIASELDMADADADIESFKDVKKQRDAVHDMSVVPDALPTGRARNLLRKYLRLHLTRGTKN